MEKLLSKTKNKAGYDGRNLNTPVQKIFSLAVVATKIFFAAAHRKSFLNNLIQDELS